MVRLDPRATIDDLKAGSHRSPPGGRSYWPNMSGTNMLVGGMLLATAVGYYWLYADRKDRPKELNRTAGGYVEPPDSRLPRK